MIKKIKCRVLGHTFATPTISGKKMLIMQCLRCGWVPKYDWWDKEE